MTALAMDVRELSFQEIDFVSAAEGFFEAIGSALDNPFTTAGKVIDYMISHPIDTGSTTLRQMVASGV